MGYAMTTETEEKMPAIGFDMVRISTFIRRLICLRQHRLHGRAAHPLMFLGMMAHTIKSTRPSLQVFRLLHCASPPAPSMQLSFLATGITIQSPQLDINTVAAGGGSRLFFRSGLFVVGPEVGIHPSSIRVHSASHRRTTHGGFLLCCPVVNECSRLGLIRDQCAIARAVTWP